MGRVALFFSAFVLSFVTLAGDSPFKGPIAAGSWSNIRGEHSLVYLDGDLLLDWEAANGHYRIFRYDRMRTGKSNPIPGEPVMYGYWKTITAGHQLIYLGMERILDWEPDSGHYRIYSFDRTATGTKNPLSAAPLAEGVWTSINTGHTLTYMGGDTVLDWVPATGRYRLWAYDREVSGKDDPFPGQALASGTWTSIQESHHLIQFNGDRVLDWEDSGRFRIWQYDLTARGKEDPFPGAPVASGAFAQAGPGHRYVFLNGDRVLDWDAETGNYLIWNYVQQLDALGAAENPAADIPVRKALTAKQDLELETARREAIAQAAEDAKNEIEYERIQRELADLKAKKQQDDAAVRRAREDAQKRYEIEKAKQELAKARQEQALARQRAIALTRQGVVQLNSTVTTGWQYIPIVYRWKLWDGSYTGWGQAKIGDNKTWFFHCPGAVSFQVKFSSPAGGEKNYALEVNQMPSEYKAASDDGMPYSFYWVGKDSLNLYKGKPKK